MPLAQSATPDPDLLVLAFLAGFAVATLIFWPMLKRRRPREISRQSTAGAGKHALREGAAAKPAGRSAHVYTPGTHAQPARTRVAVAEPGGEDSGVRDTLPAEDADAATAVPEPREREPIELPPPADLYQQHYAARFNRARTRVARIREQLDGQQ